MPADEIASLRASERRYRTLVEAVSQIQWRATPQGNVLAIMGAIPGLHQLLADQRWTWLDALHPEDRASVQAAWQYAISAGTPFAHDLRLIVQDGTYRAFHAEALPIRDENGQIVEWAGLGYDITAQRQDATRLAWLQLITATLGEAMSTRDVAHVISELARVAIGAHIGLLALRSADGLYLDLVPTQPTDEALVRRIGRHRLDQRLPITEAVRTGVAVFVANDPAADLRFADLTQLPVPIPTGAVAALPLGDGTFGGIILGFVEPREFGASEREFLQTVAQMALHAVERVRLYEDLRAARAQAEAAVRMRDQFLSVATHELKTPMTALLGQVQLLERRATAAGLVEPNLKRSLQQIALQTQRLDRMLNELLDVSRLEQGQLMISLAALDLSTLLGRVVAEIQPSLSRHSLDVRGLEAPRRIIGDELRLVQVFQNLLANAVKYSPFGGTIQLTLSADSERALVTIRDQGIGIPSSDLPHIFERFYRGGNSGRWRINGTGIGLYVVAEVARCHGGTVRVTSTEGEGSAFTVELPLDRSG